MRGLKRAAVALLLCACHRTATIPTYVVAPSTFVRRVTADGNLKAKSATPVSAPPDAPGPMKIAWIADDGALVKKDDVLVRFDPTDFETLLVSGREDDATAGNKLRKTSVDADTTRDNLRKDRRQATAELASARRFRFDDADVFSRFQRIESQVDESLALARRDHAGSVLGVRESLSQTDRDLIDIDKKKAALKIRNAEQGLHAIEVHAPHDGILVLQRDWRGELPRVGGTVWSGSALGETARVSIDAHPGTTYGGTISQIDKLARPRVRGVPVQYFGVTIALDRCDPAVMKPGARVKATIEVESRANAVSIPRQALFENEGKRIVYVRRGGAFVRAEVTIGSSTAGRVVVTKGIAKGDELALVEIKHDS